MLSERAKVGSATSLARGEAPLYLSQPSLHSFLVLPSRGAYPVVSMRKQQTVFKMKMCKKIKKIRLK